MLTAPGIGSGLDINGIVSQLMELERRPLLALENKQIRLQTQITAYGQLKGALSSFQGAVQKLSDPENFGRYKAISSDSELLRVSASQEAVSGTYSIQVNRLAQNHKLGSAEFSGTAIFGGNPGDSMTLQLGSSSMTLDLSTGSTLDEIRAAIMEDENNPGISATVIHGNGGQQKLVLTSSETGEEGAITLAYEGSLDSATFGFQTLNEGGEDLSLLDAEVVVDSYAITRVGNSIDDIIQGVTLDLKQAQPGQRIEVSVERDLDTTVGAVKGFVDAYNQLRSDIGALRNGELNGEGMLLLVENRLLGVMNESRVTGTFRYLSDVGISVQKDGRLTLDTDRLEEALVEDSEAVTALFADEANGYASRFDGLVKSWLERDGLLDSKTGGLGSRIDRMEDQQQAMERRLEQVEARYLRQFNAMDSLVTQLNGMSAYLSQQLAALPGAQQQ